MASWWRMTSSTMKEKNDSAKIGSSPESAARERKFFAGRIRRRQIKLGLEHTHLLGAPETLGKKVDERGIQVVDRNAVGGQPGWNARPALFNSLRPRRGRAAGGTASVGGTGGRDGAHAVRLRSPL